MSELQAKLQDELRGRSSLCGEVAKQICAELQVSHDDLLLSLLDCARQRSVAPISEFRVGAVLQADNLHGGQDYFLGANYETEGGTLQQTVHAEQAAIHNALVHGAGVTRSIAVSAMPCGHCRQFMCELAQAMKLSISVYSDSQPKASVQCTLSDLLPMPFGPVDLGLNAVLLSEACEAITRTSTESLQDYARRAIQVSYAPYSKRPNVQCVALSDGRSFAACLIESAAFNPSLEPSLAMQSLLSLYEVDSSSVVDMYDFRQ